MKTVGICRSLLVLALAVPCVAQAAQSKPRSPAEIRAARLALRGTDFRLTPSAGTDEELVVSGQRTAPRAADARSALDRAALRLGAGREQQYIDPAFYYRTARRGPTLEVAALGGGMENAPFLAHVAMNWRF